MVADELRPPTVKAMYERPVRTVHRHRRSFTLLEMGVVIIIAGMLFAVLAIGMTGITERASDEPAKRAVTIFVHAQMGRHDLVGVWWNAGEATTNIIDLDVVAGDVPSNDELEISMATGVFAGYDRVAGAALSRSGNCVIWRSDETNSPVPDFKSVLEDGPCTGERALTTTQGTPW